MKCPNCGAEIRNNASFCGSCGQRASSSLSTTATNSPTILASSSSLTTGSRLQDGRYIIKQILGQGGMGAALLATDTRLDDKQVVIKELISDHTDPTQRLDDVRNFKREVSTLARIDHPLVPNVSDHFQEGTRYFMVQEYVEGQNLEEYLDVQQKPMPEREVLVCASEVLDVLDYLAQQTPPIVHRDIKPANIIIGKKDRRAHLVDFGIARADENKNVQRKQTSALGTPGYAPPEQYQGNADQRSDLYALAATLHHLLTNRDPRNYPPFAYPPVHTLNIQLNQDIERIITKALNNDITQRYQNSIEMKQDIDNVLRQHFGISRNIDSYMLGVSGQMNAISATSHSGLTATVSAQPSGPFSAPTQISSPQAQTVLPATQTVIPNPVSNKSSTTPIQPLVAPPLQGSYQPNNKRKQQRRRNLLLILAVLLVLALIISGSLVLWRPSTTASAISVTNIGGEPIGISDGSYAFDTTLIDGSDKTQAAQLMRQNPNNLDPAISSLNSALRKNINDAEALIYKEDINVLRSKSPYVTLVVGTMLSGPDANISVGRDDLQGAYVAQKEFNDGERLHNGVQVRLLIANAGSQASNVNRVAQQIIELSQQDKTFAGVMGWPFTADTQVGIAALKNAHIPLISQSSSSDALSGSSPSFFRIVPPNTVQGQQGAIYAENVLHAHSVALFYDPNNSYSKSLAVDFRQAFEKNSQNKVADVETYTVGQPSTITTAVQKATSKNIDLIYFSGYAADVSPLLINLPPGNLPVLGGDALYELGGYSVSARQNLSRLHFTAGAYPDEWDVLHHSDQKPAFFNDYSNYFNSDGSHPGGQYSFTRPTNDAMLSYDATLSLLTAYNNVLSTKTTGITPQDEGHALAALNGSNAIQGVSGQIAFDKNGDPIDKAIVVLYVDSQGRFHMDPTPLGRFLK
jgi:serine/threonine protein kinase/ABC-type branched-subunit amino acid transport system substrate-binding protein